MAFDFPTHKSSGTNKWESSFWDGTSGSISYGATTSGLPVSGDLVLLWIVKDDDVAPGTPSDGGAAYTLVKGGNAGTAIYYTLYAKFADGTEGSSVSWTSDSEEGVAFLTVFSGGSVHKGAAISDTIEVGTEFVATDTTLTTYNITPSWSGGPTRWGVLAGWDSNSVLLTYGADYTESRRYRTSSTGAGAAGGAVMEAIGTEATSPSAGAFTIDDAEEFGMFRFAIRGVSYTLGPGFTLDAHFKVTKTGYSVLPTHVGHSSNFDDATGSVSVSKPAGTQEGDLMVAFYSVIQNTPSSGYRFIGANPQGPGSWIWRSTTAALHAETLVCFTHVATDDEPDTYYFYSDYEGTDGYEEYGNMVTIVVSRNTEWVDGNVAAGSSSGTDSTTPTLTSERGIFYAAHGSDVYAGSGATASHPEDWTEVSEQEAFYYNTSYHSQSVAYKIQPGLTDAVETATWSRSVSSRDMIFVAYGEATEGILVDAVIDGPPGGDSFTLDALISKPVTGSWRPIKELPNQTTGTYNYFGESVAISGDGKVVIVGNTSDDSGGTANNGRVWVFSGGGWDAVTTLVGDPNTDYAFGHRIEVTSDGSTIFVSDYYDSTAISNAGVVYKFDGVGWGTRTKLGPPVPQATGRFGYSMALSRDDSTLVVGEPGWDDAVPTSDVGRVYAFSGTDWATVTALDTSSPEAGAQMGFNAAVSSDGSIVVAGSYQKDSGGNQEGAIDIFYGSSWGSSVIRQEATPASTDNYGRSVGVLPNGDIVASYVGGWGRLGKVEVLDATDTWTTRTDVTDQVQQHPSSWSSFPTFNQMVRSSSTGLAIIGHEYWSANGSSSQGRAYIFDTTDDWKLVYELERPADITTSDYFGSAVAISDDGNYAVVGARYYDEGGVLTNKRGRVWLYKYPLDFVLDCWIGMGGEFTLDAVILETQSGSFAVGAIRFETFVFDTPGQENTLYAAIYPRRFEANAVILRHWGEPTARAHDHYAYTGSTDSWTHTPPHPDFDTIIVIVSNYNDAPSGATYGGLTVPLVASRSLNRRLVYIYARTYIGSRTSDTVEVAGIGSANTSHASIFLTGRMGFATSAGTGWVSHPTGDYTITLADTIAGDAYREHLLVGVGETGEGASNIVAYGDGDLLYVHGASGTSVATVLTTDGPDTNDTTGGYTVVGASSALRYELGALFQSENLYSLGFTVDAYTVPAVTTLDAIIHKEQGADESLTISVDYRLASGGDFAVAAAIKHTQSSLIHYDDMSPDNASSWGSPDVGNDYTYYLRDGTPFTKTGGYGVFVASGNSSGSAAYFNDDSYHADKEVYLEWATSNRSAIRSSDHDFGLNDRAYLRYIAVNINSTGTPDSIQLWVDGANRGSWYLSGKWNASYPRVCLRYRVEGTVFKAKAWLIENSEPDWLITYDGSSHYSTEASRAYFKDGSGFWWDGPWTKRFDNITITSLVVPPILLDAYINEQVFAGDFTVDAQVGPWFTVGAFIQPSFTLDAELYYAYLIFGRTVLVRAYITPASAGSFSASAVIATGPFFYANAYVHGTTFSFTLDYVWTNHQFFASAFIGTKVNHVDFLVLRAYVDDAPLTKTFSGDDGWPVDAHIDGADGTVELDAVIRGLTEASSFGLDATSSAVGEERGQFAVDAIRSIVGDGRFLIASVTAQNAPLRLDAVLAGTWTLDAVLSHLSGSGTMTTDAWVKGIFRAPIDAVIADGAGDYRGGHLDAVIFGSAYDARLHFIEVLAKIVGSFDKTFAVDAMFNQAFTLDARIWQPIFVDAYIESDQYIVYPPSQEGDTGTSTDGSTFSDPGVSFSPGDVGTTITIEGVDYVIATVVDENTVTVAGGGLPFGEGDLEWYIPSGNPTDPLGNPPLTTRISRILIEWSRPDSERWTDLTGDVLPAGASFTQSARVGPGTFEMTLKGAHPEFVGGEEIRVSVDGFRVFGGYVSEVGRGYAFEDDSGQPLVFLSGTDYNVLLDRLLIYNAEWDGKREGSGPYRTWKPFAKGTLDSTIIRTVADRFMSDPGRMGLDMTTYVDTIETPAPTTGFQMESGMTLRNLLTEISRITEGVWYVDAYKDLHYHDRSTVTAPFPITDGDGGIACRGLKISSTISVVANDVFVWGTQAFLDTGDSDIIYSRQTADQDWDVDWWTDKIAAVQAKIDAIRETPYDERTLKQRARLEALRKSKVVYGRYLAKAQASTEEGSVARFGRWQHAEFRQDIYQQSKVDRRAKAVMQRYSEPVVKGAATVFDPGFGAGQVAEVVSVRHGVADELPIRQMTIDFATAKEPVGDEYHAVPRYSLTLGLDPEEPWDIYQFLPFPDLPDWNVHFNIPTIKKPVVTDVPLYLDTFERMWASDEDFGTATNERDETRDWGPA